MKLTTRQLKYIIREAIAEASTASRPDKATTAMKDYPELYPPPRKPEGAPPSKHAYILMYKDEPLAAFTDPNSARVGNSTIGRVLPLAGGSVKKVPLDLIEDQLEDLVHKIKDTGWWKAELGGKDLYW